MPQTERMLRAKSRVLGGVCVGFAAHTGLSVHLVRSATVVLALLGGSGVLLYAWLWATVPDQGEEPLSETSRILQQPNPGQSQGHYAEKSNRIPVAELLVAAALLLIGIALIVNAFGVTIPLTLLLPVVLTFVGTGLAWRQFSHPARSQEQSSWTLLRVLGSLVLVALGILLFFVTVDEPNLWTVMVASFSMLLGVGIVLSPWLLKLYRDLERERTARARSQERTEIATHLHDSVLQTLALIQQKSDGQSEVARIARAQERELRDWLFQPEEATPTQNLGDRLKNMARTIEDNYPVRFEVVIAGGDYLHDAVDSTGHDALAAAAGEAMLNAARHAGGDVSVFVEARDGSAEVSVVDRGPGIDHASIPEDRHGIRESIVGRMERAGGSAVFKPGPGGTGTAVHIRLGQTAQRVRVIGSDEHTSSTSSTPSEETYTSGS